MGTAHTCLIPGSKCILAIELGQSKASQMGEDSSWGGGGGGDLLSSKHTLLIAAPTARVPVSSVLSPMGGNVVDFP